jgi:hypothetical protein
LAAQQQQKTPRRVMMAVPAAVLQLPVTAGSLLAPSKKIHGNLVIELLVYHDGFPRWALDCVCLNRNGVSDFNKQQIVI